jgi:O-antigen/teichoic acid export membrane protein
MLFIVAGSLLLTALGNCFDPIFMATVRFSAVALSDLVSRVASLAAVVVLVTTDASVLWFAAVQLVPPFVLLVIQGIAGSRIISWRPYFSFGESWDLLRESLPQTGVLIIGVLYWRADGLILTLVSDTVEVGVYGLAYTVAFTASVVSTFYLSSTLSSMTDRFTDDRAGFARFVESSMKTMAFVALPVAVAGLLLGPGVIELMGSSAFVPSGGPALSILFVAVGMTFMSGAVSQALFAAHEQVFLLRLNVVNLAINIALNLVLIPMMGAKGAAISLVFSETCGLVVASWKLSKVSPYRTPWMFLVRSAVPLGATVGVLLLMSNLPVILAAAAAAIAYFVVSAVAGPMTLANMKHLIGRGERGAEETAPKEEIPV